MTIIEKIKNSIEGAVSIPFYYHAGGELNNILDGAEFPCAYAFLLESGTIADVNGLYHERISLAVFFCDLTEFDFDSFDNERIIDECKQRAFTWLSSLRMSDDLSVVSVTSTSRVYDQFDAVVTGYGVQVTIEEEEGFGICQPRFVSRHFPPAG